MDHAAIDITMVDSGSCVLFGYGNVRVVIFILRYVADGFEFYAGSALASLAVTRFVIAGVMAIVAYSFYHNLGVACALTIAASLGALLVPVSFVFYNHDHSIRTQSVYALR